MDYVSTKKMDSLADELKRYLELKAEYGTAGLPEVAQRLEESLAGFLAEVKEMPIDEAMAAIEPNGLDDIKALRPEGARVLGTLDVETYKQRLLGALVGRMAGCTLGAPVEFWSIDRMEKLAKQNGTPFPPVDYWTYVDSPFNIRYIKSKREAYTRDKMDGVPVDDDVEYTLTGLVVVEKYGLDFTTADVGATWKEVLPMACTAEKIALENLGKGIDAMDAGLVDNPYCEWIGADIRCDLSEE